MFQSGRRDVHPGMATRMALQKIWSWWLIRVTLGLCALILGGCVDTRLSSHGRFAHIDVTQPQSALKTAVLLLSGANGPDQATHALARALAAKGALVATLNTHEFLATFAGETGCSTLSGDLDNLGRYLEAAYQTPVYSPPILAGVGEGATLAFAALAQADPATFAGALALGFDPGIKLPIQPCAVGALVTDNTADGASVRSAPQLQAPWFVLVPQQRPSTAVRAFVHQTGQAQVLPMTSTYSKLSQDASLTQAYKVLKTRELAYATAPLASAVADLPLVDIVAPSGTQSDTMAIMLSGDGGWAGIDKGIGQALAASGIPVVGFDTLRYYWTPRTPDESAHDLNRVIDYYRTRWHKSHVLLVGYSFGADVMPFLVNRLPKKSRNAIARVIMLGLGSHAQFEFHTWSWLGLGGGEGYPTLPEVKKLPPGMGVCIYGTDDDDSICGQLKSSRIQVIALSGGHHFDGNDAKVARLIRGALQGTAALVSDKPRS